MPCLGPQDVASLTRTRASCFRVDLGPQDSRGLQTPPRGHGQDRERPLAACTQLSAPWARRLPCANPRCLNY